MQLIEALSPLEFRIYKLLKEGLKEEEICSKLGISKMKLIVNTNQIKRKVSLIDESISNTPGEPFSTNEMDYGGLGEYCKLPELKDHYESDYGNLTVGTYQELEVNDAA